MSNGIPSVGYGELVFEQDDYFKFSHVWNAKGFKTDYRITQMGSMFRLEIRPSKGLIWSVWYSSLENCKEMANMADLQDRRAYSLTVERSDG